MSEPLSDHERETTLRVARAIYPHDALPDEAYEKVVRGVEAEADGNEEVRAAIEQGIAGLDDPTPFGELDADAQTAALPDAEGTPFFDLVRATAVVELYDNPLVWQAFGYPATHDIGTARMSERPEDGVVNGFGQAHDVPNLFVSDASQFTTGAAANPTLTIVALAIRQAEYITGQLRSGAIPTGHAVWDGRDPGGPAPDAGDAPDLAESANR